MKPYSQELTLGDFKVHLLKDGFYRLDGGAMFGVVPKVVWEKRFPPDEQNRIRMGLNCLLVETPAGPVLVEAGIGSALEEKEREIFALEQPSPLPEKLAALGFPPESVAQVIITHLNFDHAGHCTKRLPDGTFAPTFPNARHHIQEAELAAAQDPPPGLEVAFPRHLFEPVLAAGLWTTHRGEAEPVPGIRLLPTYGHTPGHQSVLLESGGRKLVFWGDLVPTSRHLDPRYGMAYDLDPMQVLAHRRELVERSVDEEWIHTYPHEPEDHFLRARRGRKYYETELVQSP